MFAENSVRSLEIKNLLEKEGFLNGEIGIAIIDLKQQEPKIFGYNIDHFIYPASVYKIFIGAEMLRRVEIGDFSLEQMVEIKSPNDVDKDTRIFSGDTRKLLNVGDKVSVDCLLDLMLTRSDNTASNTLIDLVGRESITEHIIHKYNWHGSEVTRKFLDRIKEDKPYRFSETTMSCARHCAEFMYLVETEQLVSPFVSKKLKEYMLRWNREGRGGLYIPEYISYYRKGGWLETNFYKTSPIRAFIRLIQNKWTVIRWSNDCGVVTGKNSQYVVSVFTVTKTKNPYKYFDMRKCAKVIFEYMENYDHEN
ncbi:MAG: serine hydrolase [bacterium]